MIENAYNFEFEHINGNDKIKLADYKNRLILIVNTASLCGFTSQYSALEQLWQNYWNRGLVVIAIPSNNFGNQDPKTNGKIAEFCQINYKISFPIATKTEVTGTNSHPFFNWSRKKLGWLSGPKWNFYKYLIDKNGELIYWTSCFTSPTSSKLQNIINKQLS